MGIEDIAVDPSWRQLGMQSHRSTKGSRSVHETYTVLSTTMHHRCNDSSITK